MILEYKLNAGPKGMHCPHWLEDGGYFRDPDNHTMIGWSPDKPAREYYIPSTVIRLTSDELNTRVLNIHSRYPFKNITPDGSSVTLTTDQVTAQVTAWVTAHS
tara:strand:+ start:3491 stop:3799 length:309 start_codon:yes stop_codon:yes gene_type:complete